MIFANTKKENNAQFIRRSEVLINPITKPFQKAEY